jgi:hypothetical protein
MSQLLPQIGFDRFIHLDWVTAALNVRAGRSGVDELSASLEATGLSVAALKKVQTVLNRLWLEPRPELAEMAARGVEIYKSAPDVSVATLSWGMAIATYSFFGKVAELVGRLSALQGDCTAAEVHRRMSETYGEREGTYRMTNMVLQSQASWGAIERAEKGKRLIRRPPTTVQNEHAVAWLIEAALRYSGKAVAIASLPSMAVMFPFVLDRSPGYVASKSPMLELRSEGTERQSISLAPSDY